MVVLSYKFWDDSIKFIIVVIYDCYSLLLANI